MANQINNGQVMTGKSNDVVTCVVYIASSGSFKVQMLCGDDVDNDQWVDIPDSEATSSTVFSFHADEGHRYKFVLTGDAVAVY